MVDGNVVSLYDRVAHLRRAITGGKVVKGAPSVVDGIAPARIPITPGANWLSVEGAAGSLFINEYMAPGCGYQRELKPAHVRSIARALKEGAQMPPLLVSLIGGRAEVTDGQQRAAGHLLARMPVEIVAAARTLSQAEQLFAAQRYSKSVDPSLLVLTGDDAIDLYVQDAVTSPDHPWRDLIAPTIRSNSKITPNTAKTLIWNFGCDAVGGGGTPGTTHNFSIEKADELAEFIEALGSKTANPLAYKTYALRAYVITLTYLARKEWDGATRRRCREYLAKFPFQAYAAIKSRAELQAVMVAYWNKRLSSDRRLVVD